MPRRPREMVTYHCCAFVAGLDGGIGKQNVIHRLALRTVGRDGVAGQKFAERFVQDPAIGQFNSAIGADRFDRDQFAVGHAAAGRQLAIGLEMQPVAFGDRNFARLADGDLVEQLVRDRDKFPVHFDQHADLHDARQFSFRARFGLAHFLIEHNDGIWRIKTLIAFLRVGQVNSFQRLNRRRHLRRAILLLSAHRARAN